MLKRHTDAHEFLRKVPLFSRLNKEQIEYVARVSDRHEAKTGDHLTDEGHLGHEFVLIVEGTARAVRNGQTVAEMGPGDFFGEMSMIDGGGRSATVVAETEMEVIVVDGRAFWPLLQTVPGLAHAVIEVLAQRIRSLQAESHQH